MKIKIYNIKQKKARRKYLRNNMTVPEVALWQRLKDNQLGHKFRRQHSVGKYILDFYCPELKLAIEVDGSEHFSEDRERKDKIRDNYLKNLGIRIKRYTSNEVMRNLAGVVEDLNSSYNLLDKNN